MYYFLFSEIHYTICTLGTSVVFVGIRDSQMASVYKRPAASAVTRRQPTKADQS